MRDVIEFSKLVEINPHTVVTGRSAPFIGMEDVSEDGRLLNIRRRSLSNPSSGLSVFRDDDVLFAKITPCMENGKGAHVAGLKSDTGLGSTEFHVLRARQNIHPRYVFHWTRSKRFRQAAEAMMSGSAGQRRVPTEFFHRYTIPRFDFEEQRRIVEILDAVDDQIDSLDLETSKLRSLRSGVLRHAMGSGLALINSVEASRFREIDGFTADGWSAVRLGSLVSRIEAGNSPDLEDRPAATGEWGVLKVSSVSRDGFRSAENKVAPDPALHYEDLCVQAGDLIMTRANTADLVGLSCIAEETSSNLMLCDKTLRLIVNDRKSSVEFINLVLEMHELRTQIQIAATGTSASMKNISQPSIRSLLVPYSTTEMERICRLDTAHRKLIGVQQAELLRLRDLRLGIMEDLLTGRVRVGTVR